MTVVIVHPCLLPNAVNFASSPSQDASSPSEPSLRSTSDELGSSPHHDLHVGVAVNEEDGDAAPVIEDFVLVRSRPAPGDGLLTWTPLLALMVLIINDHFAKHAYPSVLTGKLSDVSGLVFFPLLLEAIWELCVVRFGGSVAPDKRALWVAMIATGIVFTLTKTWHPMNELIRDVDACLRYPAYAVRILLRRDYLPPLGHPSLVMDPTDLLALPALAVAYLVGRRRHQR